MKDQQNFFYSEKEMDDGWWAGFLTGALSTLVCVGVVWVFVREVLIHF